MGRGALESYDEKVEEKETFLGNEREVLALDSRVRKWV